MRAEEPRNGASRKLAAGTLGRFEPEAQAEGQVAGTTGETCLDANRDANRRTAGQLSSDESRQSVAESPGDRIFDASRDLIVGSAGGRFRRKPAPETPLRRGLSFDASWSRATGRSRGCDSRRKIGSCAAGTAGRSGSRRKSDAGSLAPPEGMATG